MPRKTKVNPITDPPEVYDRYLYDKTKKKLKMIRKKREISLSPLSQWKDRSGVDQLEYGLNRLCHYGKEYIDAVSSLVECTQIELSEYMNVARSTVSGNMIIFSSLGVMNADKEGRNVIYTVNKEGINKINTLVHNIVKDLSF